MTAVEMLAEIRYMVDEPTVANWTDVELLSYINQAQAWFASLMMDLHQDWFVKSAYLATLANTPTIALPSDHIRTRRIEWINGDTTKLAPPVLVPVHWQDYDYGLWWYDMGTPNAGTPRAYGFQGNNLKLFPAPDSAVSGAIRIYYVYRPADLTTATTGYTSDVPAEWHPIIVLKAAIQAMRKMEQDTTVFDAELNNLVQMAVRALGLRQVQDSLRVSDVWE